MNISGLVKQRSVLVYYALVLIISWGGFLMVGGRGLFYGTDWEDDPRFPPAVLLMLLGPPVAGVLTTIFTSGKKGIRELFSCLLLWRVGKRWYAAALLIAPVTEMFVLFSLSQISPEFFPKVFITNDKLNLLFSGVAVGLIGGFVEELGWTGFVVPKLSKHLSLLSAGLIVGVFWGVWHMPQMWWVGSTSFENLSPAFFFTLYFLFAIAQLTAFRLLMIWVYENTKSLLVAILMHASYIFSTLFALAPPTKGISFLIYSGLFTVILWLVVVRVILTNHRRFLKIS